MARKRGDGRYTAEALRSILKARGWSQGRLALLLGVSPSTVWHWLRGETRPSRLLEARLDQVLRGAVAEDEPVDVRALRTQLGMTQAELAAAVGVRANTVSLWECRRIGQPSRQARLRLRVLAETAAARNAAPQL